MSNGPNSQQYKQLLCFCRNVPFGNKIPSSGIVKVKTSPAGTSANNKVAPVFEV
jgi:hypothetical protein